MKNNILFVCLLKNNENYIPYMFKIFETIKKDLDKKYIIKILIYTNNNKDKTEILLNNKKTEDFEIIIEDIKDKEEWSGFDSFERKVTRLYYLRENLLNEIKKKSYNYLFMFDSDIYFNSSIIKDMIKIIDNEEYEAVTTNTLGQNFSLYYDYFSLIDENNKKINKNDKLEIFNFNKKCFNNNIINTKSSFGGLFLIKYETMIKKSPSYLNNKKIDKNICEHIPFNKNLNIAFATNINPIRVSLNYNYKHKKAYNIIKNNLSDNRTLKKDIGILLIELVLLIFTLYLVFKLRNFYLISLIPILVLLIINNFNEFF